MSNILTAMAKEHYENDESRDISEAWGELPEEEQAMYERAMAAACRVASERLYESTSRMEILASAQLKKIAEQAND